LGGKVGGGKGAKRILGVKKRKGAIRKSDPEAKDST